MCHVYHPSQLGLEDIPTGNAIHTNSPVLETTPLPNANGKRPVSEMDPKEVYDLELISPTSSKFSKSSTDDEVVEITPPSNATGKRSVTQIQPIEFPDLALISPGGSQGTNASPGVDAIDLSNMGFKTPPTTKIALVPVKLEKKK